MNHRRCRQRLATGMSIHVDSKNQRRVHRGVTRAPAHPRMVCVGHRRQHIQAFIEQQCDPDPQPESRGCRARCEARIEDRGSRIEDAFNACFELDYPDDVCVGRRLERIEACLEHACCLVDDKGCSGVFSAAV